MCISCDKRDFVLESGEVTSELTSTPSRAISSDPPKIVKRIR